MMCGVWGEHAGEIGIWNDSYYLYDKLLWRNISHVSELLVLLRCMSLWINSVHGSEWKPDDGNGSLQCFHCLHIVWWPECADGWVQEWHDRLLWQLGFCHGKRQGNDLFHYTLLQWLAKICRTFGYVPCCADGCEVRRCNKIGRRLAIHTDTAPTCKAVADGVERDALSHPANDNQQLMSLWSESATGWVKCGIRLAAKSPSVHKVDPILRWLLVVNVLPSWHGCTHSKTNVQLNYRPDEEWRKRSAESRAVFNWVVQTLNVINVIVSHWESAFNM